MEWRGSTIWKFYRGWIRRKHTYHLRILRVLLARMPSCYPDLVTETHPHQTQYTYQSLYERILLRELIKKKQGYQVVTLWEHEFDKQFQKDQAFQDT